MFNFVFVFVFVEDSGLPPFPSFGSHHRMGNGNGGSSPRPPSSSDISSLEYFRCASLDQHSVHKSSMAGNGGIMLFRPQHYINPEKMVWKTRKNWNFNEKIEKTLKKCLISLEMRFYFKNLKNPKKESILSAWPSSLALRTAPSE
jgi:hypothetical protein